MVKQTTLNYCDLLNTVTHCLGHNCMEAILTYIERQEPKLWAEIKDNRFIRHSVVVAMYKDFTHIGYCALKSKIKQWFKPTSNLLAHNQKVLCQWGKVQINVL